MSVTVRNVGTAEYDPMLGAPACANPSASCTSGPFLAGRGPVGPEPNQPNAIDGCADGAAGTFHVDESIDELKVATLDGTELTEGATVAVSVKLWAGAAYASDRVDLYTAGDASAPQWNFVGTYAIYQQGAQTLIPKIVLPAGATQVVRAVLRQSGSAAACTAGPYDDHDDLVFAVRPASGPPPTIAITAPADGQTIRGSTSVTVAVTNAAVIEQVELLADGVVFAADATAPYYALYDPLVLGTHVLVAQARDVSGNVATSEPVTIFAIDGESPTVRIVSPAAGEHVSGTVTVTADATDDVAVQSVEFFADSRLLGSDQSAPYQVTWATSGLAPGAHTLFAQAYDTSNNVKGSDYVTVYVDGSAPSVSILSPPQYATVSGTVPVSISASDPDGVLKVELYVSGQLYGIDTAAPWEILWTTASGGQKTLEAKAYDSLGNVSTSAPVYVNVDNPVPMLSVTAPAAAATVGGTVTVSAAVSANSNFALVDFWVTPEADPTTTRYVGTAPPQGGVATTTWASGDGSYPDGEYSILASGLEGTPGNYRVTATSPRVFFTLDNLAPATAISSPLKGSTVSGIVPVNVTATDGNPITKVELWVNGVLYGTDTVAPYSFTWDTTGTSGTMTLVAKAYSLGRVGSSETVRLKVGSVRVKGQSR